MSQTAYMFELKESTTNMLPFSNSNYGDSQNIFTKNNT